MKTAVVITLLLLVGCSSKKQRPLESVPLLLAERTVTFSAPPSKDLFRLVGVGSDTASAEMAFLILNRVGDTLFAETFPSRYLLDYGFPSQDTSNASMGSYIAHRVTTFFDEDHFTRPAVPMGAEPDTDFGFTNIPLWSEIRGDSTVASFHFRLGEEDNRVIVYSRKHARVEMLRNFD